MKIKTSDFKRLVRECINEVLQEFHGQPIVNFDLVKTALKKSQFDKDMASRLLQSKQISIPFGRNAISDQDYMKAAEYLQSVSPQDLRGLFASIREEEQPEPHDPETDTVAPGPRQRPEDWKKGGNPTNDKELDKWQMGLDNDKSMKQAGSKFK